MRVEPIFCRLFSILTLQIFRRFWEAEGTFDLAMTAFPHFFSQLTSMTSERRRFFICIGGFFGAALVHSLLPVGDMWMRAAFTGATAVVLCLLLALLLPNPPES